MTKTILLGLLLLSGCAQHPALPGSAVAWDLSIWVFQCHPHGAWYAAPSHMQVGHVAKIVDALTSNGFAASDPA